jgi:transposase InsO family protein
MEGKKPRPEGRVPKGHWILPEECDKSLAFKRQHPTVGGVRLAFLMLDQGVAAVSPSTVFRILKEAGLSSQWTLSEGRKASKKNFHQPKRPREQWRTDIAYANLRGTHYFFISVLDGYSRSIVFWDLRMSMTTADVGIVIQRAWEALPKGLMKPRIISDNGLHYLSTEFRSYLRDQEVAHSRIRGRPPQSNGKMERIHKRLRSECTRQAALPQLEEARSLISGDIEEYNT